MMINKKSTGSQSGVTAIGSGLSMVPLTNLLPNAKDCRKGVIPFAFLSETPEQKEEDALREQLSELPRLDINESGEPSNDQFDEQLEQYRLKNNLSDRQFRYLKGLKPLAISLGYKGKDLQDPPKGFFFDSHKLSLSVFSGRRRLLACYINGSVEELLVLTSKSKYDSTESRVYSDLTHNLSGEAPPIDGVVRSFLSLFHDSDDSKIPTLKAISDKIGIDRRKLAPQYRLAKALFLDEGKEKYSSEDASPLYPVIEAIESGVIATASQLELVMKPGYSHSDSLRALENFYDEDADEGKDEVNVATQTDATPESSGTSTKKKPKPLATVGFSKGADPTRLNKMIKVLGSSMQDELPPEILTKISEGAESSKQMKSLLTEILNSLLEEPDAD